MAHQVTSRVGEGNRRTYELPTHVTSEQLQRVMTAISGRNGHVSRVQIVLGKVNTITVQSTRSGQAALDPDVESAVRHILGDDYTVVAR